MIKSQCPKCHAGLSCELGAIVGDHYTVNGFCPGSSLLSVERHPPEPAATERKIVVYRIIRMPAHFELETDIREMIVDGWQPLGGVSFGEDAYMQAMVRYE